MLILNIGDKSRFAEDVLSGTITVGELKSWLDGYDDCDEVIVRTDDSFAELDSYEGY